MSFRDLIHGEMSAAYAAAEGLVAMADDLDWKPSTGDNWMTTGQLLEHITTACGFMCDAFAKDQWLLPDGSDLAEASEEEMMPPAEALPSAESVEAALAALQADKASAFAALDANAERLTEPVGAPWDPTPKPLGTQMLMSVNHLNQHKGQLFYYLKLQGKPVNTFHYYGMPADGGAG